MHRIFKREMASLEGLFDYIGDFVTRYNIDDSTAHVLNLAIEEIFTNLVKYDAAADPDIPIGLALEKSEVIVDITNTGGHEFDITAARAVDTSAPLAERRVGGLGLHLVRHMVDDISYQYTDGTSRIRIVKRLEDGSV